MRNCPSTRRNPRSSSGRRSPVKRPPVAGRRPVATRTASASSRYASPRWVKATAGPGATPVTPAPVNTSTPSCLSCAARLWPSSRSRVGRRRGAASRMVTRAPAAAQTHASSTPITPPPMMARRSRGRRSDSRPSLVTTPGVSRPGMGGRAGSEPAATRMWAAS